MSTPPKFATLADAIAAYRDGRSRRWAEVDGHQVDLHAAANPCAVSRPGVVTWEETATLGDIDYFFAAGGTVEGWNRRVEVSTLAHLARAALASEVLPELAVPSEAAPVERCPWCGHVEEVKP